MGGLSGFRPTKRTVLALVLALAGFVVTIGDSGQTIEGGRVTDSYEYNYAAVGLGSLAIAVAALEAMRLLRTRDSQLPVHLVLLAGVGLLGLYQILSGSDLL
jgi:drug/metabolite transporter (DMT)-like permease